MQRYFISVLLCMAMASLGIGTRYWLTSNKSATSVEIESDGEANTTNTPTPAAKSMPSPSNLGAPIKQINTLSVTHNLDAKDQATNAHEIMNLYQMALKSDAARKTLMDRYLHANDGDSKGILGALLSKLQTPDIQNFAIQLAESSDPQQRKDGFALLENQDVKSQKVRELALQALATEKDPDTLRHAIAALQPTATETSENASVLQQLQGLSQHQDSSVRAQAVNTLAGWDKNGESVNALQQALTDSEPEVRWAAVDAIAENRIRSEGLKSALIDIASNTDEAADLRLSAANTLEHFALNQDEYTRITQATKDVVQEDAETM